MVLPIMLEQCEFSSHSGPTFKIYSLQPQATAKVKKMSSKIFKGVWKRLQISMHYDGILRMQVNNPFCQLQAPDTG